jgi:hypothetical protein
MSSPVPALMTRFVQVLDQEQDAGSGVGPTEADVVEAPLVAQGDEAD